MGLIKKYTFSYLPLPYSCFRSMIDKYRQCDWMVRHMIYCKLFRLHGNIPFILSMLFNIADLVPKFLMYIFFIPRHPSHILFFLLLVKNPNPCKSCANMNNTYLLLFVCQNMKALSHLIWKCTQFVKLISISISLHI